jgi:opacity protein-like surface antigen
VELFGGYSYTRLDFAGSSRNLNLNGWQASVSYNFNNWLGATAEFSGQYGRVSVLSFGPPLVAARTDFNHHTFLFGPRLTDRKHERFTPFAHALFGVAREGFGQTPSLPAFSETKFALALGGGLDWKLSDRIAVRLAQADYQLTRQSNFHQSNFRYSGGLVLRFGKR